MRPGPARPANTHDSLPRANLSAVTPPQIRMEFGGGGREGGCRVQCTRLSPPLLPLVILLRRATSAGSLGKVVLSRSQGQGFSAKDLSGSLLPPLLPKGCRLGLRGSLILSLAAEPPLLPALVRVTAAAAELLGGAGLGQGLHWRGLNSTAAGLVQVGGVRACVASRSSPALSPCRRWKAT